MGELVRCDTPTTKYLTLPVRLISRGTAVAWDHQAQMLMPGHIAVSVRRERVQSRGDEAIDHRLARLTILGGGSAAPPVSISSPLGASRRG